jgi:hypothetical protein
MSKSAKITLADVQREQSAGEFLAKMATEIKGWLHNNTLSGAMPDMQWILTATLADGTKMVVHQASASGHAIIKLTGELANGGPGLIITHLHSVQFLASYIPCPVKVQQKREIGFHTGIGKDIKIAQ